MGARRGAPAGLHPAAGHDALYNFRGVPGSPVLISTLTVSSNIMATTKKPVKPAKPTKSAKLAKPAAPKAAPTIKPVKDALTKSSLTALLAEQTGVDTKSVKAVLAAMDGAILGSVHKNGVQSFTLPGLLKIEVQNIPAKPKRKGINPFTKQEQVFAAKPATVRIKARALKKLKDAAL